MLDRDNLGDERSMKWINVVTLGIHHALFWKQGQAVKI